MSQHDQSDVTQQLNPRPDNNSICTALDNVLDNVIQDMDFFLPAITVASTTLPPIPQDKVPCSLDLMSHQLEQLEAQQIEVVQQQHKQMTALNTMHFSNHLQTASDLSFTIVNHNHNTIAPNTSYITPNTSYNSLASLDTTNTSTSSTLYPQCGPPPMTHYDEHKTTHTNDNIYEYVGTEITGNNIFHDCSTKITAFEAANDSKIQLKDYVFISKDCTRRLGGYIVKENWGKEHGLLYKYIDYIFRCQAFKRQIVEINDKYLVFHSGLQRRSDNKFLFVLLVPNKKYVAQRWRVQFGNIKNSFMCKDELLAKFTERYVVEEYLPQRTKFCTTLSQLLYDETYAIEVNWEERLTTNKDRLCRVLGNLAFFDYNNKNMKIAELVDAFDSALQQTQRIAELNPRLAVAQGFVDSKHCKYRMELLLPLVIEFPKSSGNHYTFALAISKSTEPSSRKYIVKSILTMDMAYANARLVGYVDSCWLYYGSRNNGKMSINDFFLQNNVSRMYRK
eukprot:355392_1